MLDDEESSYKPNTFRGQLLNLYLLISDTRSQGRLKIQNFLQRTQESLNVKQLILSGQQQKIGFYLFCITKC
jgi:hypothetical protein